MQTPPGVEETQRFRPKLRYELIGCGLNGHVLLGTHTRHIRPEDRFFVRETEGLRWYRCLRCDSWLPLPPPKHVTEEHLPQLEDIQVPLRGKPLRDRYVLRLIALDRAVHVIVLGLLALTAFWFTIHRAGLQQDYIKILNALQPAGTPQNGELIKLHSLFKYSSHRLYEISLALTAYAALEASEMIGLWFAKRWAEYLTFVATIVFIPYEIYDLVHKVTVLRISAFIINLAVAAYLLYAKRLFGLRGGGKAEKREREHDTGWEAIRRATPKFHSTAS